MKFTIVLCVFLAMPTLFGQVQEKLTPQQIEKITSKDQLIAINSDALMNNDFGQAMASAKRLIELDSNNANYNYRYGLALNLSATHLSTALPYLEKAVKSVGKDISVFSRRADKAPVEAYYQYALTLHRVGNINAAIDNYKLFIENVTPKHPLYKLAQLGLVQAQNALNMQSNPQVKSLVPTSELNSGYSEFSPITSFDGTSLYFSSDRPWKTATDSNQIDVANNKYHEAIYASYIDSTGHFKAPELLNLNKPDENISSASVSIDERRVYVYSSETGNGDIYYSDFKNGKFNSLVKFEDPQVNTNDYQSHFYVTPDNRLALFTSEMKGGQGGLDIWMMKRQKDGKWSAPTNLGSEINSKYDEDAPFITFDGKTLYYSSNNEKSIGGFDIFKADYIDGKFVNPTNLGTPINSTYDDIFYTVTSSGQTAYLSSFRKGGQGALDLYMIQLKADKMNNSVLKGRIYMANNKETIPEFVEMRLVCKNCEEKDSINVFPRVRDGKFFAMLDKCKDYDLVYLNSKTGKIITTQSFKTECNNQYEEIHKELGIDVDGDEVFVNMHYALQGKVYDKETNLGLADASIEIQDENGEPLQTGSSIANGNFTSNELSKMQSGKEYHYKLVISKPDYITVYRDITVTAGDSRIISIDSIPLEKNVEGKDLGKVLVLNPIYYDLNSSYLRPDAKVELDKIVETMNLNPTMTIDLRSHTDCRESNEYNMWLSDRRAKRALNYLKRRVTNGRERLTGRGYGETQLLNNCGCDVVDTSGCTEEEHQMNRRTEFIITHK